MKSKYIFKKEKYEKILEKFDSEINYYNKKMETVENKFWVELLNVSKNRCYYCGDKIDIFSYEREHRIDKALFNDIYLENMNEYYTEKEKENIKEINKELKKSKYNLIPCCRYCNKHKELYDKEKIRERLLIKKNTFPDSLLFNSLLDIEELLGEENNYLDEKIEIDFVTFTLRNNILKNEKLNFRQRILKSIEKLIEHEWEIKNPNFIEEILIDFSKKDHLKKDYLILNYRLEHLIFY